MRTGSSAGGLDLAREIGDAQQLAQLGIAAWLLAGDRGVLVHLGIDTVRLDGAGFELLVEAGATVVCGQPMVRWDPAAVQAGGLSPICPVVALDATDAALNDAGGLGVALAHLAALVVGWSLLARAALQRF